MKGDYLFYQDVKTVFTKLPTGQSKVQGMNICDKMPTLHSWLIRKPITELATVTVVIISPADVLISSFAFMAHT